MDSAVYYDDLIRDYLLFRSFTSTLKAFEAELKTDKDKGFRVDKIVDQLCSNITSYDLSSLRDAWCHLDHRVFSRLESQFLPTVRKLENGLLKMYVVNAVQTNRTDKLHEFFERMSLELQNQPEWKEWFMLPFMKSPEENPMFAMYFTRQWQDTILVSLHNFLSVVFQCMPLPTLLHCEDEQSKVARLTEENEALKQKIASLQRKTKVDLVCGADAECAVTEARELMDDFYIIAQEAPSSDTQSKSIRSIIRNISSGFPTSPILGRRQSHMQYSSNGRQTNEDAQISSRSTTGRSKIKVPTSLPPSVSLGSRKKKVDVETNKKGGVVHSKDEVQSSGVRSVPAIDVSEVEVSESTVKDVSNIVADSKTLSRERLSAKSPFILLSQDEYREHQSMITHCKFNAAGSVVASSDINGIIKIWSPSPTPQTLATVMSKSSILALDWASKLERLLLFGNTTGTIRLYDTKEKKTLCEVGLDPSSPYREQRITSLACSPTESSFICGVVGRPKMTSIPGSESTPLALPEGRLLIWDMKSMRLEKTLSLEPLSATVNCCVFNHNGQLLLAGAVDGRIRLFDMRCHECIATWQGHQGSAHSVQFSFDETSCYSLGEDGKFIQWNVNKTGKKMSSTQLHDGAAGPFVLGKGGAFQFPVGKLFASDAEGRHILTCSPTGGLIYMISQEEGLKPVMSLGGHQTMVVTVDWSTAMDCGTCITASLDGEILISTLLAQ